jgi:Icc protein
MGLVGINPFRNLQQILFKISQQIVYHLPDLIVLTGDISQDYSLSSYKTVLQLFKNFPCTTLVTMGNHDDPSIFMQTFGQPTQILNSISSTSRWRVCLLNSNWPKHVDGQIAKADLDLLEKNLATNSEQPTIIFLHHPVLKIGSSWLDKIKLQNSDQLLEIIDRYQSIKAVVSGHVHQESAILHKQTWFLTTPATSWQFAFNSSKFKLDKLMPGYRWFNLYADGSFDTKVIRIEPNDEFLPDMSSTGY